MSTMIKVRNVSDELYRALVRRAEFLGLALTACVESVLEREGARPPRTECLPADPRSDVGRCEIDRENAAELELI